MQIFKAGGREWVVTIDIPRIKRIRASLNVDLGARDCSQLETLTNDPVTAAEVLWALCQEQAEKANVSQETFLADLKGDDGETASIKLIEAIIDFFPTSQREALHTTLAKHLEAQRQVLKAAQNRLEADLTVERLAAKRIREMNFEIDKMLDKLLDPSET